jgi:hypothetical protein
MLVWRQVFGVCTSRSLPAGARPCPCARWWNACISATGHDNAKNLLVATLAAQEAAEAQAHRAPPLKEAPAATAADDAGPALAGSPDQDGEGEGGGFKGGGGGSVTGGVHGQPGAAAPATSGAKPRVSAAEPSMFKLGFKMGDEAGRSKVRVARRGSHGRATAPCLPLRFTPPPLPLQSVLRPKSTTGKAGEAGSVAKSRPTTSKAQAEPPPAVASSPLPVAREGGIAGGIAGEPRHWAGLRPKPALPPLPVSVQPRDPSFPTRPPGWLDLRSSATGTARASAPGTAPSAAASTLPHGTAPSASASPLASQSPDVTRRHLSVPGLSTSRRLRSAFRGVAGRGDAEGAEVEGGEGYEEPPAPKPGSEASRRAKSAAAPWASLASDSDSDPGKALDVRLEAGGVAP